MHYLPHGKYLIAIDCIYVDFAVGLCGSRDFELGLEGEQKPVP